MSMRHLRHRAHVLFMLAISLSAVVLISVVGAASVRAAGPHVDVTTLNSDINPGSARFMIQTIQNAASDGAQALIIQIDTPGGDLGSMKQITQAELSSRVPIITYVSPTGGRAASAGAFVALSAPIVAMAPITRIGAASPVDSNGGNIDSTLRSKIENDLVAQLTGVQKYFGRETTLTARMVTQASAYDDSVALQQHIVDLRATTLNDLLNQVNGRQLALYDGDAVTLHTAGDSLLTLNQGAFDGFYTFLVDPNVAFLLFIVALIGIYLEFSHPGMILPGVAGGIALILFFFAAGSLAPNWAGLILMGLALVLLIMDVRLPTHGVLTAGAAISLVVGSLLFFNSNGPTGGPEVNPLIIYVMGAFICLLGFTLVLAIFRSRRHRLPSGVEAMLGARAVAITNLNPEGRVNYSGENWQAFLVAPYTSVEPGSTVIIVKTKGLLLYVRPLLDELVAPEERA